MEGCRREAIFDGPTRATPEQMATRGRQMDVDGPKMMMHMMDIDVCA